MNKELINKLKEYITEGYEFYNKKSKSIYNNLLEDKYNIKKYIIKQGEHKKDCWYVMFQVEQMENPLTIMLYGKKWHLFLWKNNWGKRYASITHKKIDFYVELKEEEVEHLGIFTEQELLTIIKSGEYDFSDTFIPSSIIKEAEDFIYDERDL